jgi:hypothetical protein
MVFEVAADEGVYRVCGAAIQRWSGTGNWNGPKGYLFRKLPGLE